MDLNDIAVVSTLGIDYKDEFIIYAEIRKNEKDNPNASILYRSKGKSLDEALENMSLTINKVLYLVDINSVIITDNLINNKLNNTLDYLTRESNIGYNFKLVATKDNIEDIIKIANKKEQIAGSYIKDIITNKYNNTIDLSYNNILIDYLSKYKDCIIPFLRIIDDKDIIIDSSIGINKYGNIILLDKNSTVLYNLLNSKNNYITLNVIYDNQDVLYRVKSVKTDIKYDNKIFNINIDLVGNLNEMDNVNLKDNNVINKINKLINKKVTNEVTIFLDNIISDNLDLLGFKKIIFNNGNKVNSISDLKYDLNIKINIEREELLFDSLGEEI